ncbi:hypothetical protein F5X96DRAFT_17037 [Biscogniauxia mediterranea]|nr:hypothetical protein F5X96DRAFT_17037 [Biscogniauxia mediterranea]
MATNGNLNHSDPTAAATSSVTSAADQANNSSANSNLGKDEVAWFFVEQYYTTLSKTPEKLHLFYGKRSQFVYGQEAQVANVSVGRSTIQERIKELDFQDCKVRVSNVDSQASFDNIVIQVIGETSNKAGDPKKFVQTFVLAQQPSGYFVLNDILRYINEESDEEPTEAPAQVAPATQPEQPAPVTAETKEEPEPVKAETAEEAPVSLDPVVIDKKLEEVSETTKDATPVNGDSTPQTATEQVPAAPEVASKPQEEPIPDPETTVRELAEEDTKEPEKPANPNPTPIAASKPPAPAPAPAQPPKPMTWASRIAAVAGPRPAVPIPPKTATPTAARPAAAAPPTQPAPAAPAPSTEPAETTTTPAPTKEASTEWQTARNDSKRQNRPQSISGSPAEKEGTMGYVKNVNEKVKNEDLEAALAQHGPLVYFDINRQKNCAFVEFATQAGYQAAVAANPHIVNGESITVEPRRPKSNAYGGSNYASGRGNLPNRGARGGFDGGRSGSQGGRGNYSGQNRGRGGMTRGRGASQAANA